MGLIAIIFHRLIQFLVVVIIVQVVLTYFLPPYNRIRVFLDRLVEPMLVPIRRVIPPISGLDFSPVVLVILLQILDAVLTRILVSLAI